MHIRLGKRVKDYLVYTICFFAGMGISRLGHYYLAGAVLMCTALVLYIFNYIRTENLVDIRGLFSLSWIGGIGIACLQLSKLQTDWADMTWICFYCIYLFFMSGYDLAAQPAQKFLEVEKPWKEKKISHISDKETQARKIMHCILFLGLVSVGCFILEAVVVGFIPLFSPEPHAYSYFHISGVHYFTISCILIPALSVLYCYLTEHWNRKKLAALILGNITAVAIPILCVSRFQLLFAVGFAAVTYLMLYHRITWKMVVGAVCVMIPLYVLLTIARRHDISYLNGIFEMKYEQMPIFITQPYIYVANNFENFNCLVTQLPEHTWGIRMLFPFFALTGLKFVFPEVSTLPLYITKTELTTLTMFYDAYYDFGIAGVIVFAALLGVLVSVLTIWVQKKGNPAVYLFYGQIAIYFGLSFFTTWFSNPTTWFWFALTFVMYIYTGYERKRST